MALRGQARHRACGQQGLVVGVGVERHDRGGHRRPSSRMAGCGLVKVAMLTDCYPPRLGGIESQVRDLSRQLVRAGHEVEVFTATTGPDGERQGATHRRRRRHGAPARDPAAGRHPGQPVRTSVRCAVGSTPGASTSRTPTSGWSARSRRTWCRSRSTRACRSRRPSTASSTGRRGVFRALGHLGALGAARRRAQRRVERWRPPACPLGRRGAAVEVVPNGVDAAWWRDGAEVERRGRAERRRRSGCGARPVHVVSAMRLVSRKRPLATLGVLRGARAILDPAVPLRATIVGEGPQRRVMERYLRTRGMDWVELPGRVDQRGPAPAPPVGRRLPHDRAARGVRHRPARGAGGRGAGRRAPRHRGRRLRRGRRRRAARRQRRGARRRAGPPGRRRRAARPDARSLLATPPAQDWRGVLAATLAEYRRAGVPVA